MWCLVFIIYAGLSCCCLLCRLIVLVARYFYCCFSLLLFKLLNGVLNVYYLHLLATFVWYCVVLFFVCCLFGVVCYGWVAL